jgi:hypothetical protein
MTGDACLFLPSRALKIRARRAWRRAWCGRRTGHAPGEAEYGFAQCLLCDSWLPA